MIRPIPLVLALFRSTPAGERFSRSLVGGGTGPRWATGRGPRFGFAATFEA